MGNECKVITTSSLKGGVGKSTNTILIANNLAARGFKVLVIDMDTNNSCTMYYTTGIDNIDNIILSKNIFEALSHNKLIEYIVPSTIENVDIIPSSLDIDKLRGCSYNELAKTLKNEHDYDYIIIDTTPHYDNILINALNVSDIILTPLDFDRFNVTTTHHLMLRLSDECPGKLDNWFLFYSRWEERFAVFEESLNNQFVRLYESQFGDRLIDIHVPKTNAAKNYTELGKKLNLKSKMIGENRLATEYNRLVNMITGADSEDNTIYVEKF